MEIKAPLGTMGHQKHSKKGEEKEHAKPEDANTKGKPKNTKGKPKNTDANTDANTKEKPVKEKLESTVVNYVL